MQVLITLTLKSNDMLERYNEEIRRRTHIVRIFLTRRLAFDLLVLLQHSSTKSGQRAASI